MERSQACNVLCSRLKDAASLLTRSLQSVDGMAEPSHLGKFASASHSCLFFRAEKIFRGLRGNARRRALSAGKLCRLRTC